MSHILIELIIDLFVKEPLALPGFAKYLSFMYSFLGIFSKPVSKLFSLSKLHLIEPFKSYMEEPRLSNISVTFKIHNSVIYENCKIPILRFYNFTYILILVIIGKIIHKI